MSRSLTLSSLGVVVAGAALAVTGSVALAPSASALTPPSGLVVAPDYCVAVYGDPSPCPPPDRPDPIDPRCLRVDIGPAHCPWLP